MTHFRTRCFTWFAVLTLLLAALLPANLALAQDAPPEEAPPAETPPAAPEPAAGPPGATLDAAGNWRMANDAAPVREAAIAATAGGPDDYGYTWTDVAAFSWIDATNGTDTGLTGDAYNRRTGAIPLPFAFKHYDATYTNVYIGAAGYVAFQDSASWYWDDQVDVPSPGVPNPVVAPYSTPLDLATSGKIGRVFYKAGGAAPNRYFVVTWNEVQKSGEDDKYTFQVVLYENGDILFQYKTMTYGPDRGYYCGYVGIEDAEGLDGFTYADCDEIPANRAIRFTRPAASARVKLLPRGQGRFTHAANSEAFEVTVYNNGELGADTYNVTLSSPWPATVQIGGQALTDSDGNGVVDTGAIAQGARKKLTVHVQTPAFANVADFNTATLTLQSTRTPAWSRTTLLRTTVPAPFAQSSFDAASPGSRLTLLDPNGQINQRLTTSNYWGGEMAIGGTQAGGYLYAWDEWLGGVYHLRYALLDKSGALQIPIQTLTTVSPGYFAYPGVAVAPDGAIGIAWTQVGSRQVGGNYQYNYNVYLAILNAAGGVVLPPTNLTDNTAWGGWDAVGVPNYYYANLAASGDNRFFVTWNDYQDFESDWTNNIYYTVYSSAGQPIKARTLLAGSDADQADAPRVTGLSGNRFLLSYYGSAGGVRGVRVTAFSSSGNQVTGVQQITSYYEYPRAVTQLSNGAILAIWRYWSNGRSMLRYAVLDSTTLAIANGPFDLANPFSYTGEGWPSVVADANGRAVVTWGEVSWDYRPYHFYALIDSTGAQVVPPTPWLAARTSTTGAAPRVFSSTNGYGIAPGNSFAPTSTAQPDAAVDAPSFSTGASAGGAQIGVRINNLGLVTASGVTVTMELDPQLTFLSADPPPSGVVQAAASGSVYTWNTPDLLYLSQGLIVMNTGVPSATVGSRYPVTITVGTTGADANQANNRIVTEVMAAEQLYLPAASRTED